MRNRASINHSPTREHKSFRVNNVNPFHSDNRTLFDSARWAVAILLKLLSSQFKIILSRAEYI